jgi:hypothetical protein
METLARRGEFTPPRLDIVEAAANYGISLGRGRVFVDLWDIRKGATECHSCMSARIARLHEMNLSQRIIDSVTCTSCGGNS